VQAVIRLSKKYLPGMAISYKHPKVDVHIGDGFKFLADYKDTFDVIITDSSDPEGPAESLFQKPYFELLHGALKEGGIITTQGKKSQLLGSLKMFLHHFPHTSSHLPTIICNFMPSMLTLLQARTSGSISH
jgi:spermidine synthase